MSYETILYETKERIAHITLNRPRVLNAYNDTMGDELLQAHRAFDQDDDLHEEHSVILTPPVVAVDDAQTPDRRCRYIWHSAGPTSDCC